MKDARLLYNLGVAYEKSDDFESARRWYEEAVKTDPNMAQANDALQRLLVSRQVIP